MTAAINMTGRRIGHLVVTGQTDSERSGAYWDCDCDCGGKTVVSGCNLRAYERRGFEPTCSAKCPLNRTAIRKKSARYLSANRERLAAVVAAGADIVAPEHVRPKTRRDCVDGPRPCPFVGCRHHLYLDVTEGGELKLNFPGLEPDELEVSCSLDVADTGWALLEEVGAVMGVTAERVRQLEFVALRKMGWSKRLKEINRDV